MSELYQKKVEESIRNFLAERFNVKKNTIQLKTSLIEDLGMDSFQSVELLYELELQYKIRIPNEALKDLKKIGDIINYICNHKTL